VRTEDVAGDGEPFEQKMARLVATLEEQIRDSLRRLGYGES
jgi:hypothetical protein